MPDFDVRVEALKLTSSWTEFGERLEDAINKVLDENKYEGTRKITFTPKRKREQYYE